MDKPIVIMNPAECWKECPDPQCHYVHTDTWHVIDGAEEVGPFRTEREANEAAAQIMRRSANLAKKE